MSAPRTRVDLIVVGCVSGKGAATAEARDLYTSPLFRKRRAYAEAAGLPWLILSAKYGLVRPDAVIEPYNLRMQGLGPAARAVLVAAVRSSLLERSTAMDATTIELHAGEAYHRVLREALGGTRATILRPLQGLGIGQQLAWYARTPPLQPS